MKSLFRTSSLMAAGLALTAAGSAHAATAGTSAYYTIQANSTKDAFIHTISWVALDTQYGGSVYDNPLTTGVNEGDKDFINNNTSFGNFGSAGGSAFELHSVNDPLGQTRYEYLPGVEVRYQPPHAGGTNSYAGGYVYLGTDGSDGAVAQSVSTPKWDDIGSFTTEPNGIVGDGWEGVTGFRTVSSDGTGTQFHGDGLYIDTDDVTGGGLAAPIDDVGLALVGFDAAIQAAPNTGYVQFIVPISTTAVSTDTYFEDPNGFWPESGWKAAYVQGVHQDNLSIELTVTSDASYVAKTAVSGDFDGDLDVDNADIGVATGNFTGAAGAGEFFGQYYRDGDVDGDMDIDNADIGGVTGNFTGAAAGNLTDTVGTPNLVYDPATGNVTIDAEGLAITSFQFENGDDSFVISEYNSPQDIGAGIFFGLSFEEVAAGVIGDTDANAVGITGLFDFGDIFATGLDQAGLEAYLTTAFWGTSGSGSGEFDLVLVPEPSSLALLGLGGLLLVRRRRAA